MKSGRKPLNIDIVKKRIQEKHGDIVTIVENTYKHGHAKASFIDKEYGEFSARVSHVTGGLKHPRRAHDENRCKPRVDVDEFERRLFNLYGDKIKLVDRTSFVNLGRKCLFIDKERGEWLAIPYRVLEGRRKRIKFPPTLEETLQKIKLHHGDTVELDTTTFGNSYKKNRFIDIEYGEWWTRASRVANGSKHPKRRKKEMSKLPVTYHWKTGEELISDSGYEWAVLRWLNKNKIDFNWQISFETPILSPSTKRRRKYIIDLYIKDGKFADTYIEIKGTFNLKHAPDAKNKWEWFHNTHTNSQLWTYDKLIEFCIIDKDRSYLKDIEIMLQN